jgi:hypothetical protein
LFGLSRPLGIEKVREAPIPDHQREWNTFSLANPRLSLGPAQFLGGVNENFGAAPFKQFPVGTLGTDAVVDLVPNFTAWIVNRCLRISVIWMSGIEERVALANMKDFVDPSGTRRKCAPDQGGA